MLVIARHVHALGAIKADHVGFVAVINTEPLGFDGFTEIIDKNLERFV
jgi:hypothetical protein